MLLTRIFKPSHLAGSEVTGAHVDSCLATAWGVTKLTVRKGIYMIDYRRLRRERNNHKMILVREIRKQMYHKAFEERGDLWMRFRWLFKRRIDTSKK